MKISLGQQSAFEDIGIGGLFNSQIARCVKTSDSEAIVVMDGALKVGAKIQFKPDDPCLLLWPKLSDVAISMMQNDDFV